MLEPLGSVTCLLFAGGVPLYRKIFADVAAKGYEGFELR
jgi:hypothetical protein